MSEPDPDPIEQVARRGRPRGPSTPATNEVFGQRVRVALAAARVDRAALARECQCTPQAVQKWVDGRAFPSSRNLMTLSRMTGASLEWLMWPHPVDLLSTEWAPNGVHIKNIVRQVLAEVQGYDDVWLPPKKEPQP